ncbi:dihydrolipoamide acetyltransferase family protein [Candidatus Nitrospira bockiana]
MATRVVMPKLTDTMEEGVVLNWKKREGETVASGDVLAEIETDKAVMDLEAFGSGTLRKILAEPGQTVKSGALIAVIADPDEDIKPALEDSISTGKGAGPEVKPGRSAEMKAEPSVEATGDAARAREPESPPEIKASPRARKLAAERGIDLRTIKGSGPDGRIIERDLDVRRPTPSPAGRAERPLSQMRKAIARTMTESKAPVPHFYLTANIAMDEVERLRAQIKQTRRPHPSVTDVLVKAVALALTKHPEINVSFAGDKLIYHGRIDVGVAVGLEEGLITPVVRDCGGKSLWQISSETHDLIERARARRLKPEEYADATITISNLGMFDVDDFIAVLMPPQAAALAVGAIRETPVVAHGTVTVGRRMNVTLSCDHRALDGMQAAKFLHELKRIVEHPVEVLLSEEAQ